MSSFEQEIRNQQFQNATGTAPTFRSIDGVGEKTVEKVKGAFLDGGKGRIEAPGDVQDLTDKELAETTGISKNRARKVIKGAGGNPDRDETRSSTGSVSAAGIKMPHGEFVTEVSDHDTADAKFSMSRNRGIGRSQNAAIADKSKRAPVTTDLERWKNNKGKYDFPGVDTPTTDPQVLPKDLRQEQRPNTTDPDTADVTPAASVPDTSDPFELDLSRRDVSLGPQEATGERMSGSMNTTRTDPNAGMNAGLADGESAIQAFANAEESRGGNQQSNREFDRRATVAITPTTLGDRGFKIQTESDVLSKQLGAGRGLIERADEEVGLPDPSEADSTDVVAEAEVGFIDKDSGFGYDSEVVETRESDDNIFSFR